MKSKMSKVEKWMIRWIFSEWLLYLVISTGAMLVASKGIMITKEACLYLLFIAFVSGATGLSSFFAFRRVFAGLVSDCLESQPKGGLK